MTAAGTTMHSTDDIIDRLTREIAARARLEPDQVEPDAHFLRDMGMSSLDLLNVLAFAEKSFATRFPDDRLSELTTLNKVIDAVRDHQRQQEAAGK